MMKILFVITGLGMGGAEHVVINLADELVRLGHQVKIAYLTGEVMVSPNNSDIEIIPLEMNNSKDFAKAYLKLRRIVKRFKPDVVHSHMFHADIISRLVRLTLNIPKVISTAHSSNEGGKLRMLTYRITDNLADAFINVSKEAVEGFVSKGVVKPGRMVAITNGINTDKFKFDNSDRQRLRSHFCNNNEKIILAVGRFNAAKDYPNLLNAVALLKERRQDFKVLIVGDGSLKEELLLLVKKLEITEFIEFLGIRRDIPALMSASDIFVLSSAWEGFGLVVAEAMACERVVVATDCGGVSEVVGSAGFLVEPKNSTLLAEALNNALDLSDDEHSIMGAAARERIIDNYSLSANVQAYLELYA